jgi:hypothetical protein
MKNCLTLSGNRAINVTMIPIKRIINTMRIHVPIVQDLIHLQHSVLNISDDVGYFIVTNKKVVALARGFRCRSSMFEFSKDSFSLLS